MFHCFHLATLSLSAIQDDTGLTNPEFILVFPTGSSESTLCTNISINDDALLERDQEFTLTIVDVGLYAIVNPPFITTVLISDDDSKH